MTRLTWMVGPRGLMGSGVVHTITPSTRYQAVDLRMRSIVWPDLDRRERTPVAAGFHVTMMDVLRMLQI